MEEKLRGEERLWVIIFPAFCQSRVVQVWLISQKKVTDWTDASLNRNRDWRESSQRRSSGGKHHPRLRCRPRLHTGTTHINTLVIKWTLKLVCVTFYHLDRTHQADQCHNVFFFRNWGHWTRILCHPPATYQPRPAWFPLPLTFPAPRHSQVRPLHCELRVNITFIFSGTEQFHAGAGRAVINLTVFFPPPPSSIANAGGAGRDALQSARQPEESAAAAGATTTLPGQYKQRTPMYNASNTTNPATPTSPSTPVSTPASNGPPAAATASQQETPTQPPSTPQTPTPTPTATPPQPQPKKNLSLTVRWNWGEWAVETFQEFLQQTDVSATCFCSSERSDVRCPGDVQDRQQGHQTRKSPHPGLHGWIQRYSVNYTVGCNIYMKHLNSVVLDYRTLSMSVRESEGLGFFNISGKTFWLHRWFQSHSTSLTSPASYQAEWWLFWVPSAHTHTHTPLVRSANHNQPPPVCPAENPCPEQGDIIQIKLSEHTEVLPKADGTGSTTMLVDTVFEMNYSTGQWTRLKKYKPITNTSWESPPAARRHTPGISHPLQNVTCLHAHIQVFASTFGPNRAPGGREIKERKVLLLPVPQDSSKNISVLSFWLFPLPFLSFLFF